MDTLVLTAWLAASVRLSVPILLAALGETISETAGVINLGLEGILLVGAFFAAWAALVTGSATVGLAAGMLAGGALAALFAALVLRGQLDQVVVGTAVVGLALGLTGLLFRSWMGGQAVRVPTLAPWPVPGLADLPVIGPVLFGQNGMVYLAFALVPAVSWWLGRSRPGLELRAVGEAPAAADAAGIPVNRRRFAAVLVGGLLGGLAGAYLSLGQANTFVEGMSAGRGFVAIALVVFGRWRPGGVLLAALFFGATDALQFNLQALGLDLPYQLVLALPYVLTLVVLALAPRSRSGGGPAALGQPYRRS